jgi:hypothetical protein
MDENVDNTGMTQFATIFHGMNSEFTATKGMALLHSLKGTTV